MGVLRKWFQTFKPFKSFKPLKELATKFPLKGAVASE